ncbi:MFS superfamily sulfate permease-like transporter [Dongia mobilis]|uniref:MFS superfamily sulfate permease-like transporter n=1 Tax=Dongia mobilis TaxID=578943 RepID=A0A4V3DED1_9PROT|nr:SulP family inorganic anion transporter [Dongia mobilis]TDQ80671.1 MFS superfamily sulfate permease-like transporter [Dongia mobilis]
MLPDGRRWRGDLLGAIAAAVVSLPISMTYGVIAFAPLGEGYVSAGLLAGIYGAICASLFTLPLRGRSLLALGPRPGTSLIFGSLVAQVLTTQALASGTLLVPETARASMAIALGCCAVALAGLMQFAVGALRGGSIVKYVPYPVVSGFINASALFIILGQVWPLLDLPRQGTVLALADMWREARPLALIPGLAAFGLMFLPPRWLRGVPPLVVALVGGTLVYHGMHWALPDAAIGATLHHLPNWHPGLFIFQVDYSFLTPEIALHLFLLILPASFSMALLASLDSLISLTVLDDMLGRRSDPSRELASYGIGNLATALVGGVMTAGGMNRTRPALYAGATTPRYHVMAALLMLLVLALLSDFISLIPHAVIAGLILWLGFGLFDQWSLALLRRFRPRRIAAQADAAIDLGIIVAVIGVAVLFDLVMAVGAGVALSVAIFVLRMSRSVVRNATRGPRAREQKFLSEARREILSQHGDRIAVLTLEGALFFGTIDNLERRIEALVGDGVRYLVLDMKRVTYVDLTAARVLGNVQKGLGARGGLLTVSYVPRPGDFVALDKPRSGISRNAQRLAAVVEASGALAAIGPTRFFPDTDSALAQLEERLIGDMLGRGAPSWRRGALGATLLKDLSPADFTQLRGYVHREIFAPQEVICRQGDTGSSAYFIHHGRAEVFIRLGGARQTKRLHTLTPGALFGEISLLDGKARTASVIAQTPVVCYSIDRDGFARLRTEHPEIAGRLLQNLCIILSQRLRDANDLIVELEA